MLVSDITQFVDIVEIMSTVIKDSLKHTCPHLIWW